MATNKTRLKFMCPTEAHILEESKLRNKLLEVRTGRKSFASKKEAVSKSFAVKKKASKPLKQTIEELQNFMNSYLEKRKSC
jgi:hypothetical protein